MDDPSFTEEQLQLLAGPGSADTRRMFNVLTDEEVTGYKCGQCENVPLQVDSSVRTCLASLAGPVQVVWRDQRCLDCGETGDRRGSALVTRPRRHGVTASLRHGCRVSAEGWPRRVTRAGPRRLLSQYCHLQRELRHPGRLQRVHPGGVEL